MRKNSPTESTARHGAKPSPVRAILPISTSPRRSPERSSPTSPDALAVAPTGRDALVRRVGVSRGFDMTILGRFTVTVTAVDLANNKVSVIDGRGGPIRTYAANTIAKQNMLKKIKVGDVVIGLTTPLLVTAVAPAK